MVIFALTCIAEIAKAQVLASENFNYTVGSTIGGANGGTGWAGAWTVIGGTIQTVFADSIKNFRTGVATGTMLKVVTPTTGANVRMERNLATPITDDGGTYWFGFDANYISSVSGGSVNAVGLVTTSTTGPTGPNGQIVLIGKQGSPTGNFIGIGSPPGPTTIFVSQKKRAPGIYWIVTKIKFSGNSAADTVYMFLNPDPSVQPVNSQADAVYTVVSTGGSTTAAPNGLNNGFTGIYIKADLPTTSTHIINALYDNLILGKNYSDIFPTSPSDVKPIPKYRPTIEKFSYTAGTDVIGSGIAGAGWAGPWQSVVSPSAQSVAAKNVISETILKQTVPNALEMNLVSETRIKRDLAYTYLDNGLTYWLSFFSSMEGGSTGNVMNVMLVNNATETMGASGANGQLLQIGKMNNNQDVGLGRPGTGGTTVVKPNLSNKGHWYVARIETNGTSAVDTVRLFLNPDPGIEPLVGTEIVKYAADKLNAGWKAVGMKVSGTPTTLKSVTDDIYLGLTYEEVVPSDLAIYFNAPDRAFDKFNYAKNSLINTTTTLGIKSDGWNGPWKSVSGEASIKEDSIKNFYNLKSTQKNVLALDRITASDIRLYRGLKTSYNDNGRTYWMGFWYRVNNFTVGETLQLILGDTATFTSSGDAGQYLRMGLTPDNKNFKLSTAIETLDAGVKGDTVRWVVVKIETNGNPAADTVRLFLDPNPGTEPTKAMAIKKMGTTALNGGWNGIILRASGATSTLRATLDNLYIGNTFAEIVPDDLTTIIPFDQPEVVYEPFNYTTATSLIGKGDFKAGWGGSWQKAAGDDVTLATGSIETPFAIFKGNKANINYASQPVRFDRKLKTVFKDDGKTIWMSFLIDFEKVEKISSEGQVVLMNGNTEVIGFGRTSGFNRIGFTWGPEVFEFISAVPSAGEHWVVARIDMSGNADAEGIYMWVDPIPEFQPSNSSANAFSNLTTAKKLAINNGFDGVRIKTAGSAPYQMFIDEIRIGYTYGDVSKIEEVVPVDLLSREQFRYGVGSAVQGLGTAGTQWAGPWREGFGGGGSTLVQQGSLSNGSKLATEGNHVLLNHNTATKVRPERDFTQFYEDNGAEYWLSFLADFSSTVNTNVAFLFLTNYRDFTGDNAQRLGIGKGFNTPNIGMLGKSAAIVNSTVPISGGIKWYLAKIQLTGDSQPDTVWLWVNQNPEVIPDESAPTLKITTTALNNGFQGVMLKAESDPAVATQFKVDEIRFGKTFESVAPIKSDNVVTGIENRLDEHRSLYNYPNPFKGETTIAFELEEPGHTTLIVMDMHGREVKTLLDKPLSAGKHELVWSVTSSTGSEVASGMYVYKLINNSKLISRRLVMVRD
jgi:hypothetical protein